MKKIFTLFAALAMVMSMSAVPYLKGSFNGWGESNSLQSGSTDVTLNANATYEFKVNDGSTWYGNNGTMTSTNCTDWTMSSSAGNCKIKTTIAGVYTFKWNASSKKLSVVYPTEAVEINYYITGTGNLVGGDGWKANEIKMTNNNGTYTHTFTALAAGNYEMKITQGNWDNTLGFSNLAATYVGVTGNNDNNIVIALTETTDLIVTVSGTTVSLNLPEKTNTVYFVNEKSWTKVSAYVWDVDPYKPWPGEEMTKVEGKTFNGKDVYTYTFPAKNINIIFSQNGADDKKTGDLKYNESKIYYYNNTWNATIEYDKPKYNVTVTAENGTVEGAGEYEEGKEATLTATPAEGYEFVNWIKGEEVVSTENPYKFTVTADVALVANFKKSVVTITKSFDLTPENVGNRFGRQTISVEDVDLGSVQLVIPGFSTEVTEYAEASLAIGDDEPLTATATYQNDTENNKDIYTAVATSTDGSKIYKFTFNVALPTTQNYELYAMGISATVESEEGLTTYYLKGNAILGEEYVPVEFMLDNSGYAEGTIGEVFAVGTGEAEQEGTSLSGVVLLEDESGNTYRIEFTAEVEQPEVEIVVKEEVNVALYNLTVDVQGTMAMVSAGTEELSFWLTLLQTENHYGDYTNDAFSNIWYGDDQLYAAYGDTHVYAEVDGKAKFVVSFISTPDAEGNVTKYNFALYAGEKPSDPTALDNISIEGKAAKAIINGQLIIVKDGVQYNAQGAILK